MFDRMLSLFTWLLPSLWTTDPAERRMRKAAKRLVDLHANVETLVNNGTRLIAAMRKRSSYAVGTDLREQIKSQQELLRVIEAQLEEDVAKALAIYEDGVPSKMRTLCTLKLTQLQKAEHFVCIYESGEQKKPKRWPDVEPPLAGLQKQSSKQQRKPFKKTIALHQKRASQTLRELESSRKRISHFVAHGFHRRHVF